MHQPRQQQPTPWPKQLGASPGTSRAATTLAASFPSLRQTLHEGPEAPGLDLPGLDFGLLGPGLGLHSHRHGPTRPALQIANLFFRPSAIQQKEKQA